MNCNFCNTDKCKKYDYIQELEKDKKRLVSGNDSNKKFYRKVIKWLAIACVIVTTELIFTLVFGKEKAFTTIIDIVQRFIK